MTPEIVLVLVVLAISVVFLVTEWIPAEVTALLTLGSLAVTGLLSHREALSGFSSPAVVTVWAVFILSGGLTRTGAAHIIGHYVLKLGGRSEALLVTAIMVSVGVMSAFMNNVAVAALMLPVIMDISRRTGHAPSRLLMPLAYGSLLGGLTTLIGTPPNILVSDALRDNGLKPFSLFDYTPAGSFVMIAGVVFVVLAGRHLLAKRDVRQESSAPGRGDVVKAYDLENRMFQLHLAMDSVLVGKSLAQIRLRSLLGLNVVAITRRNRSILAPSPSEKLKAGDILVVEGSVRRMREVVRWCRLIDVRQDAGVKSLLARDIALAEIRVSQTGSLAGKTLNGVDFRRRFGVNVLAIRSNGRIRKLGFQDEALVSGTLLLVQGGKDQLEALQGSADFDRFERASMSTLIDTYRLQETLFSMKVPADPVFVGKTLMETRLGDAFGMRVLSIVRKGAILAMPKPEEVLLPGDRLVLQASHDAIETLKGLEGLQPMEQPSQAMVTGLESEEIGLMEVMLSPHTKIAGQTLRQTRFRDRYDLTVLAVWREGKAILSDVRDLRLRFGDALLVHGKRSKFSLLGQDPDFLVLTEAAQESPRREKMKVSIGIFAAVLVSVILGLMPIQIAAVIGSALMVVAGCLTMDEAYRFIEWKAVFLIAGMLPLGVALDKTGAARLLAEGVVSLVGPFGPIAVMGGLVALTFAATCFVPTSALVVLMAPIALKTSGDMGISPHALMMAVALAASASFMTPVSHPANTLVMGPGGYRFLDYMKVGLPLTLVVFLVLMIVIPIFWPLTP